MTEKSQNQPGAAPLDTEAFFEELDDALLSGGKAAENALSQLREHLWKARWRQQACDCFCRSPMLALPTKEARPL